MSGVISRLFFPVACPICDKLGKRAEVEKQGCCNECKREYIYSSKVGIVNLPEFAPWLNQAICCSDYKGPVREAMHQYKFNEATYKGAFFGKIIYDILQESGCMENIDVVTAVPVSNRRFKERGYNQSLVIAKEICKLSGKPYIETLIRNDPGESQSKMLIHDRIKTSTDRFQCNSTCDIKGKALLLVDDILTTGNTLNQCGRILKSLGASWVTGVVFTGGRKEFG